MPTAIVPIDTSRGATRALASFAASLGGSGIPEHMSVLAKRHLLDQLGVQSACSQLPWVELVHRYVKQYGRAGEASLSMSKTRLDAEAAAFANGVAGHAFECDDSITFGHPGCVAVPSVIALGEELHSRGNEVLTALAIAFETITRVGLAVSPSLSRDRGFHETSTLGVFGAALACGWLLGLDVDQLEMALGIAGSHASGTTQYSQSGGDVKRLHAGLAASAGIRSSRLAAAGFSAPTRILEGRRGFLQAFAESYRAEALMEGLGSHWEFAHRAVLKPYCAQGTIIAQIDAAWLAMQQSGRPVSDIANIRIGMDRKSLGHIGTIGPEPRNATAAQFSSHYCVALALVKGRADFDTFYEAMATRFAEPEVLSLARRISVEVDEECQAEFPERWLGRATVLFTDGFEQWAKSYGKGSRMRPLSDSEALSKFMQMYSRAHASDDAKRLASLVASLDRVTDVRELNLGGVR